ncbi:Acyl-CoA N-acyltransferase [Naviculisporaceae sp. PSN 640]
MRPPTWYIETPRLTISYLDDDDDNHCDFLVKLYESAGFIPSIGNRTTPITNRETARRVLAGPFQDHARLGYGTYLVSLKQENWRPWKGVDIVKNAIPIGIVSLVRGENPDTSYTVPDLGFAILPEYMRKGYTKEACQAVLKYVRDWKGVTEVLGIHMPEYEASYAVFRSLGFKDQGLRPLKTFGGELGRIWTSPGMAVDGKLGPYGFSDEVATVKDDKNGGEKDEEALPK